MSENKDFVIDVAKEHTFQNQSETYNKEYSKWRSDENNPYAYNFIDDTRVHSYMDGEGYLNRKADVAERIALYKCLGLLGLMLFVMIAIDVLHYFLLSNYFAESNGIIVYCTQLLNNSYSISTFGAIVISALCVLKYLIPAIIFKSVTKIPTKVIIPRSRENSGVMHTALIFSLVVMVIGRLGNYAISKFLSFVNLDSVYCYMIKSTDLSVQIISLVTICILIPIACEYFYRGVVLQTFRQFGDSFAILVTCVAFGFSLYDFSYLGYAICCSVILGLFTIRTGSLFTAIAMNICATTVNYGLSVLAMQDTMVCTIIEASICTIIIALALIAYSRLTNKGTWSFNISQENSKNSFAKKIKLLLSTNTVAFWLVASVFMMIVCMRGIV